MALKSVLVLIVSVALLNVAAGKLILPTDPHANSQNLASRLEPASASPAAASTTTSGTDWVGMANNILTKQLEKNQPNTNKARNIILFLGDGLSVATHVATRAYLGGPQVELTYDKYPYVGLAKTYCTDRIVPDSACTSTAYTCGVKANLGTLGVNANVAFGDCHTANNTANHVYSIAKWAQDAGKSTGFITTTTVTHASPSGLYAHTSNRMWEDDSMVVQMGNCDPIKNPDIAYQLVNSPVGQKFNVIMGGGRQHFMPNFYRDADDIQGKRTDARNLIDAWKTKKGASGKYVRNKAEMDAIVTSSTDYILGLFYASSFPYNHQIQSDKPKLSDMVKKALGVLSKNKNGFFLFVEGGLIDMGHHMNQAKAAASETAEFARAIDAADYLTADSETLIVVTSDHSHTMTISGYPKRTTDLFGFADTEPLSGTSNNNVANDGLPYSILTYANGPGYEIHRDGVNRKDMRAMDYTSMDYRSPAGAPLAYETHGGDDVAIFAKGPWAQLFSGVIEQNVIPHAMAFAACIGNGRKACV